MTRTNYLISCIILGVVTFAVSTVSGFLGLADGSDVAVGMVVISGTAMGIIFHTAIGILSYHRLAYAGRPTWTAFLSIIGLSIVPLIIGLLDDKAPLEAQYAQQSGGTLNASTQYRVPPTHGQSFQDDFN